MSWHVRVLPNRYADSVRLMALARRLREREGVEACEVAMGTAANLEALAALGAVPAGGDGPGPSDVVVAVLAADGDGAEEAVEETLGAAERALVAGDGSGGGAGAGFGARAGAAPRSLPAAARRLGDANVALVSVAGEYAALAAHQALTRGLDAFVFSDHVGLADEVALKRRGAARGQLVMGPGCGTAMLGGVGLGFANVVMRGPVGIVAAAGTGAQETACLLDAAGVGVSHIVGVGGRDLSDEVGGTMTREGMRLLAADDETETILLVSKPPSRQVVATLADAMPPGVRVVAAFVGMDDAELPFEVHPTLEAGARAAAGAGSPSPSPDASAAVAALERAVDERRDRSAGRALLGLFSGGTLAHEAATILARAVGPVGGNLGEGNGAAGGHGHVVLDLGDEEYTRGRPHPMVDLEVRLGMLADAARDERIGCVLLDVVLGHGAHPDPTGELAEPLARVAERATVLVRVCGTRADPQDADDQSERLRAAGALVAPSNAAAARLAARAVAGSAA